MKKITQLFPFLFLVFLTACGGGTDADTKKEENTDGETKAQTPYSDLAALVGKSNMTTAELNRAVNFLNGQEITLVGHPYAYPLGEGADVEFKPNSTTMIDGMDNSKKNVEISVKFKGDPEVKMMKIGDLFAVKGILEVSHSNGSFGASTRIKLTDAEFVDNASAKSGEVTSIAELDPSTPIFCGDLYAIMHQHYLNLAKKKITVTGTYFSTTVSKSTSGEILEIRVDLRDGDNKVGCEMIEKPDGDVLNAKRADGKKLMIEGTFSGDVFGTPRISGGVLK